MDDAALPSAQLTMSPALRRGLHWFGGALALVGIAFVGLRLDAYWRDLAFSAITPGGWCVMALLAFVYGAANILLALAWWHLLRHLEAVASRTGAIRIYGLSQLAKYVPGNIFHLAGRQALGMAAGIAPVPLAKSIGWELGSIAIAGALSGPLVLPLILPGFPVAAGVALALLAAALLAVPVGRLGGPQARLALLWQTLFLLVSAAVFVSLLGAVAGGAGLKTGYWLPVGSAYVFAWLVGLVTPGAPAGVGVREMLLLFLLHGLVSEEQLLLAVLLGRMVTVVGDVLFFAAATVFFPTQTASGSEHV
ncbi:hypothetical protein [Massilia sp. Se16.2.3]|uniref:hypothetical protein n=1 Tax=Massilia sp. Se16.2.3 TaxID=2709303 RepID=UPI0016041D37|nr:hypothetical protein [Massilia sp. Se16.2.3]QNA99271.1 hypothetical protein G4G31_11110 [Massilia sp. Se16.2.3]